MRKLFVFFITVACISAGFYCTSIESTATFTEKVKTLYSSKVDTFLQSVNTLQTAVSNSHDQKYIQQAFLNARKAYKAVEVFA